MRAENITHEAIMAKGIRKEITYAFAKPLPFLRAEGQETALAEKEYIDLKKRVAELNTALESAKRQELSVSFYSKRESCFAYRIDGEYSGAPSVRCPIRDYRDDGKEGWFHSFSYTRIEGPFNDGPPKFRPSERDRPLIHEPDFSTRDWQLTSVQEYDQRKHFYTTHSDYWKREVLDPKHKSPTLENVQFIALGVRQEFVPFAHTFQTVKKDVIRSVGEKLVAGISAIPELNTKPGKPNYKGYIDECLIECEYRPEGVDNVPHLYLRALGLGDASIRFWKKHELRTLYDAFDEGDTSIGVKYFDAHGFMPKQDIAHQSIDGLLHAEGTLLSVPEDNYREDYHGDPCDF